MTRSFMAYQLQGMDAPQENAPMQLDTTNTQDGILQDPALPPLRHVDVVHRRIATGQYASTTDMSHGGWAMSYDLDGYGSLFGRWPEGTDPVARVPVRDEAA